MDINSIAHLQLALCRRNKLELLLESPLGFYTNPLDEVLAGRNIMNQANDLASSPDLIIRVSMCPKATRRIQMGESITYTVVRITINEDLPAPLPADIGRDLCKLPGLALPLDLERLLCDLVLIQAGSVGPPAQHEGRVRLVGLDDLLLDVLVDGRLDRAHEARAHVDAARAEAERGREALAVGETSRGDEGHLEGLPGAAEQDEVRDV